MNTCESFFNRELVIYDSIPQILESWISNAFSGGCFGLFNFHFHAIFLAFRLFQVLKLEINYLYCKISILTCELKAMSGILTRDPTSIFTDVRTAFKFCPTMLKTALVLVVEDDMVVRSTLETLLTDMGHKIAGFVDNGIDAMVLFNTKHPDIIIADINLNGPLDGIQLVNKLNEIRKVPVLFLTAHNEEAVFNKAKDVSPFAFIAKPIERKNLERTIALAIEHSGQLTHSNLEGKIGDNVIYTRVGHKLKKIPIREIESIEVDGKYCSIHMGQKALTCKITRKEILQVLPAKTFVQVSRNHAVNLDKIEDLDMLNMQIKMPHGDVAISRSFKEHFFSRIQVI